MTAKEGISLLPSSMTNSTTVREGSVEIKRMFHWLQITSLVLIVGWLALLTVRIQQPILAEDFVAKLVKSQEV